MVIRPGRQDGKLVIYKRSCAYGECTECGVDKFFTSIKCPLEWDSTLQINIKEYRDMERNNSEKKQKELVAVTVTANELMQTVADTAGNVIKHLWQSRWGSHMRRYDYNTFTTGEVRYKADFSATLDIHPQDQLNCAISAHAIQNVMIFSLNPVHKVITNKSGLTSIKRFITNIGFNFWASANYSLSNNYYFHNKCLIWAIRYLKTKFGQDAVKHLVGYTDGCPDQYKSRKNAVMVGRLCDEEGLDVYLHHFAPTASFKTIVDAFGSDTKTYIAAGERRETFRCRHAEDVFKECRDGMPQPRILSDTARELETCDQRIQVYLVDIKDATEEHHKDPNVIITNSAEEAWDATDIKGVKSIYALKGVKGGTDGE